MERVVGMGSLGADVPGDLTELKAAVKEAKPGTGEVMQAIKGAGFFITGRGFTRLIRACRNTRQWEKALEILETVKLCDDMVGEPPSFYTYSAVISVCSKSGRLDEAMWVLKEMKAAAEKDLELLPDAAVYRLIILCGVRSQEVKVVRDLLFDMSELGISADEETLKDTLMCMFQNEAWRYGVDVLDDLHRAGASLPLGLYNGLLHLSATAGSLEAATDVLIMMQMMGIEPDSTSCHHIIVAAKAAQVPDVGLRFLMDMHESGLEVYPETYASLLFTCLDTGELSLLKLVLEQMNKECNMDT